MESEDLTQIIVEMRNGDLNSFFNFTKEININKPDENGNTLLHIASAKGFENVVGIILLYRPEIEAENSFYWTPIMQAARAGHKNIVEKLIHHGADIHKTNFFGLSLLELAAASGNVDLVKFLEFLLLPSCTYSIKNEDISPLHIASLFGNYMVVDSLLANESSPAKILPRQGITPLICAAASGDITTVELLVVKGIRHLILAAHHGNIKDEEVLPLIKIRVFGVGFLGDFTAQDVASLSNNNNLKEFLEMFRRQLCEEEFGFISGFFKALLEDNLNELKKLCQNDPSTAQRTISLGFTPLMMAAMFGKIEVVELLLSYNADMNSADHIKGWTPIMYSLFHKNSEITLLLHKLGANVHAKGFDGISALDFVPYQSDERIFDLFSCKSLQAYQADEATGIFYNHDVIAKLNKLELGDIKRQSDPLPVRNRNPLELARGSSVPNSALIDVVDHVNYFSKNSQDLSTFTRDVHLSSAKKERSFSASPQANALNTDSSANCDLRRQTFTSLYESLPMNIREKVYSEIDTKNSRKGRRETAVFNTSSNSLSRGSSAFQSTNQTFEYPGRFQNLSVPASKNIDKFMLELGYHRISDEDLQKFKKKGRENNFILCERIFP